MLSRCTFFTHSRGLSSFHDAMGDRRRLDRQRPSSPGSQLPSSLYTISTTSSLIRLVLNMSSQYSLAHASICRRLTGDLSSIAETITLNDSTSLPYLAFGTGTALFKQSCTQQVEEAIKAGFVHIDAAESEPIPCLSSLVAGAGWISLPLNNVLVLKSIHASVGLCSSVRERRGCRRGYQGSRSLEALHHYQVRRKGCSSVIGCELEEGIMLSSRSSSPSLD
jgi:hypothetical protein